MQIDRKVTFLESLSCGIGSSLEFGVLASSATVQLGSPSIVLHAS